MKPSQNSGTVLMTIMRGGLGEQQAQIANQRCPGRGLVQVRLHGLEPALDAAVQRVVLDRLPVRPVFHQAALPSFDDVAAVPRLGLDLDVEAEDDGVGG